MPQAMKILTVVGARPQFVKAALLSRALRAAGLRECLVHTGQHYDFHMSEVFFRELEIPAPEVNLEIGSGSHGEQTGRMLIALEPVVREQKPDMILVYGDTNSTLAGALTAAKMRIPLAHVEAGLRSFNRAMPEEHNRVLTDHCSDPLFCPTQTAVENLAREGITKGVHRTGDLMIDVLRKMAPVARANSTMLSSLGLQPGRFLLATVHRAENTDAPARLAGIMAALAELATAEPVVVPLHPRTRKLLAAQGGLPPQGGNLKILEPVGYLDMLMLEQSARLILTDSGGVQKEAYDFGVPCITLRDETEWVETVATGWNVLAGADFAGILTAARTPVSPPPRPPLFGTGHVAEAMASLLRQ